MRLPWGKFELVRERFLSGIRSVSVLGCLSFEERCVHVPTVCWGEFSEVNCAMWQIKDPIDGYPDYALAAARRTTANRRTLKERGVLFEGEVCNLLDAQDDILSKINAFVATAGETVLLDITSFPKRYFAFILKRLVLCPHIKNLFVTYTEAKPGGYCREPLAQDPMTGAPLPGFIPQSDPNEETLLVVSVGFEPLNIRSLLEVYRHRRKGAKLIVPYPPNGGAIRRIWRTLQQFVDRDFDLSDLEVIAMWDAEEVLRSLKVWASDADALGLVPFGPKPHSLAMVLFGIEHGSGLFYSQPKSYNPAYSNGIGQTWLYVPKWKGRGSFDR